MKTQNKIETTFLFIMLILSGLCLMLISYQVYTTSYTNENLIFIAMFSIPVVFSFFFSASLLNDKFNK